MTELSKERIRKLGKDVISLIAAGEVIQKPFNVVKELVENSLDAHATNIYVEISNDLTCLKVRDDGDGIHPKDFSLLCYQHSTSKIDTIDDLNSINSFGFRGEALFSICQVSEQVTITSRQKQSSIGYSAKFDSNTCSLPNQIECRPCAANLGTVIMVQNLFSSKSTKLLKGMEFRKSLSNENYRNIARLICCLAVHYLDVSFSLCKKLAKHMDVNVEKIIVDGSLTECQQRQNRIRSLFGLKNSSFIEIKETISFASLHDPPLSSCQFEDIIVQSLVSSNNGCLHLDNIQSL
ncbi:hypothetical protein GJ496_004153 [Pomphorhynchus laevis]|nr:hypothetical protein GJ496_004153 [Pomphorhynchus laevis]